MPVVVGLHAEHGEEAAIAERHRTQCGELNHLEQVVAERGPLAVAWVLGYSRLDLGKLRGKKGAVVGRGEEVNGLRTRRRTCSRY